MSKYKVEFDAERCKGCCLCVSVCPKNILIINQESINGLGYHTAGVTDMNLCIGCISCGLMCPDGAICVKREMMG
ncbi:2-oxoacid:acceptor oxidoreductase subunit delta [Clostridia bacterium]|nr:2-oxoacid:acceptor oxidoreductase subunit delta [Clostridia bacterium]